MAHSSLTRTYELLSSIQIINFTGVRHLETAHNHLLRRDPMSQDVPNHVTANQELVYKWGKCEIGWSCKLTMTMVWNSCDYWRRFRNNEHTMINQDGDTPIQMSIDDVEYHDQNMMYEGSWTWLSRWLKRDISQWDYAVSVQLLSDRRPPAIAGNDAISPS